VKYPPTRHAGVHLAGDQQFKELDSGQNLSRQVLGREACRMDEGAISCFVVTLGVMKVRIKTPMP
jgi:hypothetical protein